MSTKVKIANLALTHLTSRKRINNFDTDTGHEADLMRLFYDDAVEMALSEYNFNFATKTQDLAQVSIPEASMPDGYTYAFVVPTDYVRPVSGLECVAHRMGVYDGDRVIYTVVPTLQLKYVYDIGEEPFYFPINFKMAVSYFLAGLAASNITGIKGRNSRDVETTLYAKANSWLINAKRLDGIERGYREHESQWEEN